MLSLRISNPLAVQQAEEAVKLLDVKAREMVTKDEFPTAMFEEAQRFLEAAKARPAAQNDLPNDDDSGDNVEDEETAEPAVQSPAAAPPSMQSLRKRCREVRVRVETHHVEDHDTVLELSCRLLDKVILENPGQPDRQQMAIDVGKLEEYVDSVTRKMAAKDTAGQEQSQPATEWGARYDHFRDSNLELLTTPQLAAPQKLVDYLEMINSNVMDEKYYDEAESRLILSDMAEKGEVGWDESSGAVSQP